MEQIDMKYLRVKWTHPLPDEPIDIYSEIDDEGYETRKLEIVADGSIGFANGSEQVLSTELGEKPIPSVDEIASDPQFQPAVISREDFEGVCAKRLSPVSP
jgi:hypothetical protein